MNVFARDMTILKLIKHERVSRANFLIAFDFSSSVLRFFSQTFNQRNLNIFRVIFYFLFKCDNKSDDLIWHILKSKFSTLKSGFAHYRCCFRDLSSQRKISIVIKVGLRLKIRDFNDNLTNLFVQWRGNLTYLDFRSLDYTTRDATLLTIIDPTL